MNWKWIGALNWRCMMNTKRCNWRLNWAMNWRCMNWAVKYVWIERWIEDWNWIERWIECWIERYNIVWTLSDELESAYWIEGAWIERWIERWIECWNWIELKIEHWRCTINWAIQYSLHWAMNCVFNAHKLKIEHWIEGAWIKRCNIVCTLNGALNRDWMLHLMYIERWIRICILNWMCMNWKWIEDVR